ncbi:hypothetical protein KCP70_14895 [Salmonella enterica subsp. enterica]|nr:hypothetical protein KCP70_14895 [Salmonella enterica subsp. enterica]
MLIIQKQQHHKYLPPSGESCRRSQSRTDAAEVKSRQSWRAGVYPADYALLMRAAYGVKGGASGADAGISGIAVFILSSLQLSACCICSASTHSARGVEFDIAADTF